MPESEDKPPENRFEEWGHNQRRLARTLGLSIEEWLEVLEAASKRSTLTAAVIGAAMARGLGLGVLDKLDVDALMKEARSLIDPTPPRVQNPLLKEAIRMAAELTPRRTGAARLRKKRQKKEVETPIRGSGDRDRSATASTPDAPGEDE